MIHLVLFEHKASLNSSPSYIICSSLFIFLLSELNLAHELLKLVNKLFKLVELRVKISRMFSFNFI